MVSSQRLAMPPLHALNLLRKVPPVSHFVLIELYSSIHCLFNSICSSFFGLASATTHIKSKIK